MFFAATKVYLPEALLNQSELLFQFKFWPNGLALHSTLHESFFCPSLVARIFSRLTLLHDFFPLPLLTIPLQEFTFCFCSQFLGVENTSYRIITQEQYFLVKFLNKKSLHSALMSVGRASHRYRAGHGFESRWSLRIFFWAFFVTA